MGSVWLAERADGMLSRPVALKLPRGVWSRPDLAERTAREREILGSLAHPKIARLYDAGLGADGQPFLALEYVEGRPLDEYAREQRLDLRARLGLFLQVTEAVAHAHARLVLHRDLKPSNILVTPDGEVRLLDFGIAKLLEQGRATETELTRQSGRALTLSYASPEQIEGATLTVASDVYSLGVVLFELLAEARPYRPERDSPAALEDAILRADPVAPSAAARDPRTGRALRGDLDTVILKALKKKPEERYGNVSALADDVERYLQGRPVLARPDSAWYRVRRFVGRNRLAVGVGALALAALFVGASVVYWQARKAAIAGRRAEEVSRFIVSIFQNADPYRSRGESLSATELLRQAHARLEATSIQDPALRLELLNTLGESMLGLDDAQAAVPVLRSALDAAEASDGDALQTLRAKRLHARGTALLGRDAEALAELDESLQQLRSDARQNPAELIATLLAKAYVENRSGRYEDAERSAREALERTRTRLGERRPEAVTALMELAYAADYQRQTDRSFEAARDAYELARQVYASDEAHPAVNAARMQYGVALIDQDRVDEALELMRASREDAARLFGADSRIVGQYAGSLVQYLTMGGLVEEALASSETAVRILEPLLEPDSLRHASLLDSRGLALLSARRAEEALALTTRARDIVRYRLGEEHESVFVLTVHRGRELALLGRLDEARRELEWVVDRYGRAGVSTLSTPLHQLGFVARLEGRSEEAVALQERALSSLRPGPRARRSSARILVELGLARLAAGDRDGARGALSEAVGIYEEKFSARAPEWADAQVGLGQIALLEKRPEEAARSFQTALAYWTDLDPESRWAREAQSWLERAFGALGRAAE
jgi:serine/threonine-protein kinase